MKMFNTKHRLLREMAGRNPHIRRLLPVASVVFDALDKAGIPYGPHRTHQVHIGVDLVGKFAHPNPPAPSRIVFERNGTVVKEFRTVDDAIAFHRNPCLP
jgi:hypothetical protein